MPYFFLLLNIKKTIKGKEKGDALVLSPLTLCLTKFATKKKKKHVTISTPVGFKQAPPPSLYQIPTVFTLSLSLSLRKSPLIFKSKPSVS